MLIMTRHWACEERSRNASCKEHFNQKQMLMLGDGSHYKAMVMLQVWKALRCIRVTKAEDYIPENLLCWKELT